MGEASTAYPGGRRGSRGPCSAGTASTGRLLRTPRVFTHTAGHTRPAVMGEDGKVRRSPQAMACRKRDVEERGRPPQLLHGGSDGRGSTALEAQQGKPGDGTLLAPTCRDVPGGRKAEKDWQRERPPYAVGESYRASYSAVGKAHHTGQDSTEACRPERTRIPDMADRNRLRQPPCGPEQSGFCPARMRVQPRNRMRENCTSGSARGASGNRRPYRGGPCGRKANPKTGRHHSHLRWRVMLPASS